MLLSSVRRCRRPNMVKNELSAKTVTFLKFLFRQNVHNHEICNGIWNKQQVTIHSIGHYTDFLLKSLNKYYIIYIYIIGVLVAAGSRLGRRPLPEIGALWQVLTTSPQQVSHSHSRRSEKWTCCRPFWRQIRQIWCSCEYFWRQRGLRKWGENKPQRPCSF